MGIGGWCKDAKKKVIFKLMKITIKEITYVVVQITIKEITYVVVHPVVVVVLKYIFDILLENRPFT